MKSDSNSFLDILMTILNEYNIELPKIPDSTGRKAYLDFLEMRGYSEDELLSIFEVERITPEMRSVTFVELMKAIESNNPEMIRTIGWIAYNSISGNDNSNLLIYELSNKLIMDFSHLDITFPEFYAGVFPNNSINAQYVQFNSENLILIDTGLMEMSESIIIAFLSKVDISERLEVLDIIIKDYVLNYVRPDPYLIPSKGINWGTRDVAILTNSVQNFVLTHELAHLKLGHQKNRKDAYNGLLNLNEFQEFQADIWACKVLIDNAKLSTNSFEINISLTGPFVFLFSAMFIEAIHKRNGTLELNDYPCSSDRLYMIAALYEVLEVHEFSNIAYTFQDFVKTAIELYFPEVELPPLLSKDLNRKLIIVLDSLSIDYQNVEFINDFI